MQLFEQLRKSLKQWEQNYLLVSSTDGKFCFQQFWSENQFIKSSNIHFSILPHNKNALVGRMSIPSINYGKVIVGQKVLIKLNNFRFQEYGIVEGKVEIISLNPYKKGNYYVDVILHNGLKTTYNKSPIFDKEHNGNAEIITQDLRLIERFFQQFRELLGHQV